jgi:hypothetical protein
MQITYKNALIFLCRDGNNLKTAEKMLFFSVLVRTLQQWKEEVDWNTAQFLILSARVSGTNCA